MSRHDYVVALYHMRDHAREAAAFAAGRTLADLREDRMLQLATVRLLEIVCEAANRVPPQVRGRYPAVPWREVISLRNRVVHGYDTVDLNVVWQVVTSDLPQLLRDLDAIIAQEESAQ